jgi:hypothetical protein
MHWVQEELVMLIATFYAKTLARAIGALPQDEAFDLSSNSELKMSVDPHVHSAAA